MTKKYVNWLLLTKFVDWLLLNNLSTGSVGQYYMQTFVRCFLTLSVVYSNFWLQNRPISSIFPALLIYLFCSLGLVVSSDSATFRVHFEFWEIGLEISTYILRNRNEIKGFETKTHKNGIRHVTPSLLFIWAQ